jgi:RNA polymerase sigma-70 factor (ECF subfamily)
MPDSTTVPDPELIARVVLKDERAFHELYGRHHDRVFNLAYRYTGSYADAEEISQDVFLRVFHKAASFRQEARFTTWLYRITVNACLNFKRRKKIPTESLDSMQEPGPGFHEPAGPKSENPEEIYRRRKKAELIRSALDTLPPKQRIAFIMGKFDGYSYDDISKVLGMNTNAVAALMHRAKEQLQKVLQAYRTKGEL